jgi:nicotinamidase-related amidase
LSIEQDLEAAQRLAHRPLLVTLVQKVKPAHTALVVIDMQNDFCASGGMVSKDGRDISEAQRMAARLPPLLSAAREECRRIAPRACLPPDVVDLARVQPGGRPAA